MGEHEKPEKTAEKRQKNRIKSEQVKTKKSRRLKVLINAVNNILKTKTQEVFHREYISIRCYRQDKHQ